MVFLYAMITNSLVIVVTTGMLHISDVIPIRLIPWATPRPKSCSRPNPWPSYTFKPKPIKRPNNKGHAKKIKLGFIQDGPNPHGHLILFTWAKEDVKI